ncbi:hypothetical protein [Bradyrhizobium diversitatis]|uniref:Uncharacterized protein n=1 Tax=Bradyrhizobium diversitatis TaxID=2755406 RepID=A0ABS0P089_9BRAD|nr:hypothetical protein [Bradyrhizobium diversitatis]MBH5386666.1 hypothetical protein [Bradyrhizobium diversitatis]
MLKCVFVTTVAAICWLASATAGLAATVNPLGLSDVVYSTSLSVLTMLFVVALLLESAFSTIFNWRVFLTYFSTRGVKTIIMIAISFIVVYVFSFDAIASLIAAFKLPEQPPAGMTKDDELRKFVAQETGAVSKFITSLILAGGSAGIYNLMVALGFRSQRETEVDPKPPVGQAWVAVRVKRVNAVGPVNVIVAEQAQLPTDVLQIAGSIRFTRPSLKELLLRNVDRFPQNGGYVVAPNKAYVVKVEGRDERGNAIFALGGTYAFAERAIVDFDVNL